jgi:hypothetical protein
MLLYFGFNSKSMIERQIRYYVSTDTGEQIRQRHEWSFLVINTPSKIELISQKINDGLAPICDFNLDYDLLIPNSGGLHCRVFSFRSDVGRLLDSASIYASPKFYKDRGLSVKRDDVNWEAYVRNLLR